VLRFNGRRQQPEILMEENMPCGWGMCYGCAIFTKHGVRLCCKDGPRFNLFDVY
jgi:dihydroorotate dehydrogenase electron transfer subunit